MKAGHCNGPIIINVHGQNLAPTERVKLLGIFIDNKLNFHKHIFTICSRASRQINALSRVSKFLSTDSNLKLVIQRLHTTKSSALFHCVALLFKSRYVQNGKGSGKGIETSIEWLYIIVLRTARKSQPTPSLCVPYKTHCHGNFQMFNKY